MWSISAAAAATAAASGLPLAPSMPRPRLPRHVARPSPRRPALGGVLRRSSAGGDGSILGQPPPSEPSSAPSTMSAYAEQQQQERRQRLADVALDSETGEDYSRLRDLLEAGDFRSADDECRARLLSLAGGDAAARGWVYWSEVKFIPVKDLATIDSLWRAATGGKFGYSTQKRVWLKSRRRWTRFFKDVGWTVGENNNYRKWPGEFIYNDLEAAPEGHLPVTNCLRGTQLLQALIEHPAFEGVGKDRFSDMSSSTATTEGLGS